MLMFLLVGFLLLLGIALMVLNSAIDHAADGYEDQEGFHQTDKTWSTPATDEELTVWDRMDGACCPIEARPTFRPIGHHPMNPQGQ